MDSWPSGAPEMRAKSRRGLPQAMPCRLLCFLADPSFFVCRARFRFRSRAPCRANFFFHDRPNHFCPPLSVREKPSFTLARFFFAPPTSWFLRHCNGQCVCVFFVRCSSCPRVIARSSRRRQACVCGAWPRRSCGTTWRAESRTQFVQRRVLILLLGGAIRCRSEARARFAYRLLRLAQIVPARLP